ncbi:MAG TPA: tyrosine-type recombinase/integrase [Ktedonobacteraceae bacterium]|nr:tyrosine-type recombinase/integrase [Ktedonobacteraceae bacterium]
MARRGNGEGSIYRRSDGRWTASITLEGEGRKRKSFYGKTRKEVQEQLKIALREQQQGMLMATPQQTLKQFLTQWLEDHKAAIRIRTHERYEELVRLHIVPVLGHHPLQKLTPQHVQAFYTKKLKGGLSPSTVNGLHAMLHKALDDAVRYSLIARNVCDAVSPQRRAHYEIQPFSMEQAQQFLAIAKGHALEALFVLAITTGMRRGEILALKWQDINFSQNTLQVRRIFTRRPGNRYIESEPKTEKSRRNILLAPIVVTLLKQHRTRQLEAKLKAGSQWQDRGLVFCTSLGTPLNPEKMVARFKTLLKKGGLPPIRFHDLRHSAATILLSLGVHPKVVQELLGHNQISMTMDIYSHVLPGMQRDAITKLNDALQEPPEYEGKGNDEVSEDNDERHFG